MSDAQTNPKTATRRYRVIGRYAPDTITHTLGVFKAISPAHAIMQAMRACIRIGTTPCDARATLKD